MKMNAKLILRISLLLTVVIFLIIPTCWATVVNFDDLSETGSGAFFFSEFQGYQGLSWNSIVCYNAILLTNVLPHEFPGAPINGLSGEYYGMVSPSNAVIAYGGNPITGNSEIDSATNFDFLSADLTGAWNSNLNIEVQGFYGTNLLYDTTVVASATNATLFTFNYQNINRLYFTTSGGQPAFGTSDSTIFVMDNFDFEFIPEPSSFLLTGFAALLFWPFLKRKRA